MNDYTKLIERLRVAVDVFETKGCVLEISAETCTEIADALEKLVKERDADGQKAAIKHGHWIFAKPRRTGRNATYRCSSCGSLRSSYYNDVQNWPFCPCGAKMDEEGDK